MYWSDNLFFNLMTGDYSKRVVVRNFDDFDEIQQIHHQFSILSNIVNLCNSIFGIQVLLLFGIIITGELNSINIILIYDSKKGDHFNWANLSLNLLVTFMLMVSIYTVPLYSII